MNYPVSISTIRIPKDHRSAGKEYPPLPWITSGAVYPRVPQLV